MDIETVRTWATTLSVVISAASVVFVWLKTPGEKVKSSINDVASKVETLKNATGSSVESLKTTMTEALKGHDRRIQKVEDDMRHLPTKDDLNEVTNALTAVKTEVNIMGKVVERVDDYLREHK